MATYATESIRAVALVGHGGAGKTTLAEALLFRAGAIAAKGAVEKGNTVCDFDAQEKTAGHSLNSALVNFAAEGVHVHLVDTPGYPDFAGQSIAALAGVDTALVVINAQTGIELMTERMMRAAKQRGLARMIVINKIDADNVDLPGLVAEIRERFGKQCMLLDLPAHDRARCGRSAGARFRRRRFRHRRPRPPRADRPAGRGGRDAAGPLPRGGHRPDARRTARALREGAARRPPGTDPVRLRAAPAPASTSCCTSWPRWRPIPPRATRRPSSRASPAPRTPRPSTPSRTPPSMCWRMSSRSSPIPTWARSASSACIRARSARTPSSSSATARSRSRPATSTSCRARTTSRSTSWCRATSAPSPRSRKSSSTPCCTIRTTRTTSTSSRSSSRSRCRVSPSRPGRRATSSACSTSCTSWSWKIPASSMERHPTTHETVIRGLGEMHLRYKLEKMATQYKLELDTKPPRIPYRETITKNAEGHCRHKKQTGGAGQFGEVYLKIEPLERGTGFEFVDQRQGRRDPRRLHAGGREGRAPGAGRRRRRRLPGRGPARHRL